MGKNNKKDKKDKKDNVHSSKPTVSIVTITQLKRFPCLEILKDVIKAQSYKNIIEWIVVEGSKEEKDSSANSLNVRKLIEGSDLGFPIIYLEKKPGEKLGALRNKGNRLCSGDITVVMDDDDYYPENRVEHAVEKLQGSNKLIAGCSAMYIYDYILEKLCKFNGFGENHSINSCLAWKKKYLETHSHDDNKECGEEPSFTRDFNEPMIQLDAEKTVFQASHTQNTFNKRELLTGGVSKVVPSNREICRPITDFIKEPFFSRYNSIFVTEVKSKYDIVYFAGGFSLKWEPSSKTIGEAEQAIVELTRSWTKLGKKVAVYGMVSDTTHEGVDYFDWKRFPFNEHHDLVILWRVYGMLSGLPFKIRSKHLWLDLHEGVFPKEMMEMWFRYNEKITRIFLKSNFHREVFEKNLHVKLNPDRYIIIPSGVSIENFSENKEMVIRNPYRFCYCTCYTRGLFPILQYIWPIIIQIEPRAELHVYGGMDNIRDEEFKKAMTQLLATTGVMDHGLQPTNIIAREKYLSSFHFYLSNSEAEVDCVSIKESLITGAIPIISNFGIFKEREGIKFDTADTSPATFAKIANKITELIKDPKLNGFREFLKQSSSIIPWADISVKWFQEMS
jgi:glycosyltransferase involved in cell wall biosynthesis